jgi:hypothetical protein
MAKSEAPSGGEKSAGRRIPRHYYTPQPVRDVEGMTRRQRDDRHDSVTGTGEVLIASGLLTADMLPLPGKCGIAWRPSNGKPEPGGSWYWVPGYLEVRRRPDGSFCAVVAVSHEEQARRRSEVARVAETDARARIRQERDRRRANGWPSEGDHAKRELAGMFTSHETFRHWYANRLYGAVETEIRLTNEHACLDGYDMSKDTLDEFMEELRDALEAVRHGSSVFSAAKRAGRVQELKARIAAEDDDFQPFLNKLVSEQTEDSDD